MNPTETELIAWQDDAFSYAKRVLRLKKFLDPGVVRLLAPKDSPFCKEAGEIFETLPRDVPALQNLRGHFAVLALPFQFTNITHELGCLATFMMDDVGRDKLKEAILRVGTLGDAIGLSRDAQLRAVSKAAHERLGLDVKDTFAAYLRDVIKASGAVAYVNVHEAYTLSTELPPNASKEDERQWRKQYAPSLVEEEAASECLMSMVGSPTFERHIILPFERVKRNTGRIKSFGEPHKTPKEGRFEGRFSAGFLFSTVVPAESKVCS